MNTGCGSQSQILVLTEGVSMGRGLSEHGVAAFHLLTAVVLCNAGRTSGEQSEAHHYCREFSSRFQSNLLAGTGRKVGLGWKSIAAR